MKNILLSIVVVAAGCVAWRHYHQIIATDIAVESAAEAVGVAGSAKIIEDIKANPMEGVVPDSLVLGEPRDTFSGATPELHDLVNSFIAQFSQKTLNEKMTTAYNDSGNHLLLIELLGERGYKNDIYIIDTMTNQLLRSQSNKNWNSKIVGFKGNYILFEEGCLEGCTVPINVRIHNWKSQKKISLGSAGEIHLYIDSNRVGLKAYKKTTAVVDGPEQCPQVNCCDDNGKNCTVTTNTLSPVQMVKTLP